MSLKEIYEKCGVKVFDEEVKRKYYSLMTKLDPKPDECFNIKELGEILGTEIKAMDHLMNLLQLDCVRITKYLDEIPQSVFDKYLVDADIWNKTDILKKLDPQWVLENWFFKDKIKHIGRINAKFLPRDLVDNFLLKNDIKLNNVITFLAKCEYYDNIPREICEKYLTQNYDWLDHKYLVEYVDTNFLLEVLLIKKNIHKTHYYSQPNFDNETLNNFLLTHNIDKNTVMKFINAFGQYNYYLTEEVVTKYFGNYKKWLNKSFSKYVDPNYLLKILLVDKVILNYPNYDTSFIKSNIVNNFLLTHDIDQEVFLKYLYSPNGCVITEKIFSKYIKDYKYLKDANIARKLESNFALKVIYFYNWPANCKVNMRYITFEYLYNFLLTYNLEYNSFIRLIKDVLAVMPDIAKKNYLIPEKITRKYLTQSYDWLNDKDIVSIVDEEFLFKVLFIDKKIKDIPNYGSRVIKIDEKKITDYLLKNDVELDIVISLLNNSFFNGYKGHNFFKDIFDKYLAHTDEWLKNEKILSRFGIDFIKKYFKEHQEMILANPEYKKCFLKSADVGMYNNDVALTIIDDSLAKKDYDVVIDVFKNDDDLNWWLIPKDKEINDEEFKKIIAIFKEYSNMHYDTGEFKIFVANNYERMTENNIKYIIKLIHRICLSNSSELRRLSDEVVNIISNSSNVFGKLERIENIFLKNNVPFVGKSYAVFDILHPDKTKVGSEMLSPVLQNWQGYYREIIIFADLIKASFGSNNRSVRDYLQNIEDGNILFNKISKGEVSYENLSNEEKIVMDTFCNHLITLYQRTKKGKKEELDFHKNPVETLQILKEKFSTDGHIDYDLPDRIVKMFCHFAGIDTFKQAKDYLKTKVQKADERNRKRAEFPLEFKEGDFVKGIGDIAYVGRILQNGSVAQEFLGSNAKSDFTPLDTDVCMLPKAKTIGAAIRKTAAIDYGPIYFVLKNDNRFVLTRDSKGNTYKGNPNKLEVFYTGVTSNDHYGIRTGFASSEIDYIVTKEYDKSLGLEIAINGFYIPVYDFNGNIIFTPKDYDELRNKMQGLTHLGSNSFNLSAYLNIPGVKELIVEKQNLRPQEQEKIQNINEIIKEAVEKYHLKLKLGYDGSFEEGVVELINTGSTARETNVPNSADYDYIIRADATIMKYDKNLEEFIKNLFQNIIADRKIPDFNKLRFLGVKLKDGSKIDLDLSYMPKLDKLEYSTEVALEEKLKTIKKISPQGYDYVIGNILLAKKILKENGVYKPRFSPECKNRVGGLGGAGIENWILQNNGSFFEALNSFLKVAHDKDLKEFKKQYFIWDFGENHYAFKKEDESGHYFYPHDNFVENLNKAGYKKMQEVLATYQEQYVTSLLENLYNNYFNSNITLEVYVASLEKLKNEVGDNNPKVTEEIAKYFALAKTDGMKRG